jgi:release factor glutamine methyltransferase
MRNSKAVYSEIIAGIRLNEDLDEKRAIASALIDNLFGLSQSEIMLGKPLNWTADIDARVEKSLERINQGEPVQYVTGEAYFFGERFFVDPNVLIPRPETEELVSLIVGRVPSMKKTTSLRIVDVGTGSGCIAVSLARKIKAEFFATDVSAKALSVAKRNSERHRVDVTFMEHDILKHELPINGIDVLVSNPPYIAASEAGTIKQNVTGYEPHLALFVADEDPLKFYNRIALEGRRVLNPNGLIVFEINARFGKEVAQLLKKTGFTAVEVLKDLSGKERIVKAFQP